MIQLLIYAAGAIGLAKAIYDTCSEEREATSMKKEQEKVLLPIIEKVKIFKEHFLEIGAEEQVRECDQLLKDINTKDKNGGFTTKLALSEEKFANVVVRFKKLSNYDNYTKCYSN